MLNGLFHAHSGLRYLVLLAALVAAVVLVMGLAGRKPYAKPARISVAAFTGLLDLQMLLGVGMVVFGIFYPSLIGHLTMMILAAAAAHGSSVLARQQQDARRAHGIALAGVVLALLLIVGGITAIGRGVFESRATWSTAAGK